MKDYIDKYCEMLQSQFKEHMRLTQLETQISANGFSSLTEVCYHNNRICYSYQCLIHAGCWKQVLADGHEG